MNKVKIAIKTVAGRKSIKNNKIRRFQTYSAIAHSHEFKQRTQLPSFVIEAVRAAFPDKHNKYSTTKPKI